MSVTESVIIDILLWYNRGGSACAGVQEYMGNLCPSINFAMNLKLLLKKEWSFFKFDIPVKKCEYPYC